MHPMRVELKPPLLLLAPHCLTLRILYRNKSSKSCPDVEHAGLLIIASLLQLAGPCEEHFPGGRPGNGAVPR